MDRKITSTFGQQLFFQYKDNKVAEITDNIGRKIKYEYEGEYLTSVLYPMEERKSISMRVKQDVYVVLKMLMERYCFKQNITVIINHKDFMIEKMAGWK